MFFLFDKIISLNDNNITIQIIGTKLRKHCFNC